MEVNGMGPSTLKTLHEKLGINTREDILLAIEQGKLGTLKGFGQKKIENIRRALKIYKETGTRMLLWNALPVGERMLAEIRSMRGVHHAELAGSLRRRKETIGDIDIIIAAGSRFRKPIVKKFTLLPQVGRVIAAGDTKASVVLTENEVQVDIRIVDEKEYGAALLYFTGSKEHNIRLRQMAKEKGWKISEYGLFDTRTNKWLAGKTEEEMYQKLGLEYIPPELREDRGEIAQAARHSIPVLIENKDIRGDLQMHSNWSDGAESIETIARHLIRHVPDYEYIVITDHSPTERIAHGLKPEAFRRQFKEIDKINRVLGKDYIKKGVEVDVLADGRLDLPDDLLGEFDWVTASIHSGFQKDNTDRLMAACEHPCVHCIGHPSGRLIGKREAYGVDWPKLFAKAAKTGTAIEINAQPDRMDLKDDLVQEAIKQGVMLTISTDAHNLNQFEFMHLGVSVARRGWCTKKQILNSRSWPEVEKWKKIAKPGLRRKMAQTV
jgi:DNA polymerase (family 10)